MEAMMEWRNHVMGVVTGWTTIRGMSEVSWARTAAILLAMVLLMVVLMTNQAFKTAEFGQTGSGCGPKASMNETGSRTHCSGSKHIHNHSVISRNKSQLQPTAANTSPVEVELILWLFNLYNKDLFWIRMDFQGDPYDCTNTDYDDLKDERDLR